MRIQRRTFLASLLAMSVGPTLQLHAQSETETFKPKATIQMPRDAGQGSAAVVSTLALSPDGQLIATGGDDHVVRVWRTDNQKMVHELRGHKDWVRCLSFSPDGKTLITAGDDRKLIYWNVQTAAQVRALPPHSQPIYCIAHSPDGQTMATTGFDQPLTLYDAAGTKISTLQSSSRDMSALGFSFNGRTLAASGRDGRVYTWSMSDRQPRLSQKIHVRPVRALAFSNDSGWIASAGDDRFIRIVDAETGNEVLSLDGRPGKVMALHFIGPKLLASAGSDNVIRIWDAAAGRELRQLVAHRGSVTSLAFDATTNTLLSGGYDTTVRLWDLGPRGPGNTAELGGTTTR